MLTNLLLGQIMRNLSQVKRAQYLQPLNDAMHEFEINNLARVCAFLAQIGHESGELVWMEELWGPTEAQRRYDPPSGLATRLGNTRKGDGLRFKGRGPIQITGRDNYRRYGELLDVDLMAEPALAAAPAVAFRIAGLYWQHNGLNQLADRGDFERITRRINGGLNGQAHRLQMLERARAVLAPAWPAGSTRARPDVDPPASEPLDRGWEQVAAELTEIGVPKAPRKISGKRRAAGPVKTERSFDARRDTMDFRDTMFVPTLVEVPPHVPLGDYLDHGVPILDQGREGACTGYGLATVVHYLLARRRVLPDRDPVSPRMLYEMARRYDEWPGENYEGSSARGAMKGWHKHGVAGEIDWPSSGRGVPGGLNDARVAAARRRPLGAYFRVNHKDLVAMHAAIAEVGILHATASVHTGWEKVDPQGNIPYESSLLGGHAFAIVAYDEQGLWLQNSWGPGWGWRGFARMSYDDWLANGSDVWVARLGAPVELRRVASTAMVHPTTAGHSVSYAYEDLRPHVIGVGNDGHLSTAGTYGTNARDLNHIFTQDMPRVMASWTRKRILIYAHGGLVSEQEAVQRVAEYRPAMLAQQIYPLAFAWHSDFATTLGNILADAGRRRRSEGVLDDLKDFMLDRVDDMLEPLARALFGKLAWSEMKENARGASQAGRAAALVVRALQQLRATHGSDFELHLVGHSAGSILLAPMLGLLKKAGLAAATCTLWAPACTHEDFLKHYAPALDDGTLGKLALFLLSDAAEQADHCAHVYNKSLLYLVSHAFEREARIPGSPTRRGVPLLGMAKYLDSTHVDHQRALSDAITQRGVDVVIGPNDQPQGHPFASKAERHGDFDNDQRTVLATLARVLGPGSSLERDAVRDPMSGGTMTLVKVDNPDMQREGAQVALKFQPSQSSARRQRSTLDQLTRRPASAS